MTQAPVAAVWSSTLLREAEHHVNFAMSIPVAVAPGAESDAVVSVGEQNSFAPRLRQVAASAAQSGCRNVAVIRLRQSAEFEQRRTTLPFDFRDRLSDQPDTNGKTGRPMGLGVGFQCSQTCLRTTRFGLSVKCGDVDDRTFGACHLDKRWRVFEA